VEKFEIRSAPVRAAASLQTQTIHKLQNLPAADVAVAVTATPQVRDGLEVVERVMKKYRAVLLSGCRVSPAAR